MLKSAHSAAGGAMSAASQCLETSAPTNRRAFVRKSAIALAAATVPVAMLSKAPAAAERDPIFAVIDGHRSVRKRYFDALEAYLNEEEKAPPCVYVPVQVGMTKGMNLVLTLNGITETFESKPHPVCGSTHFEIDQKIDELLTQPGADTAALERRRIEAHAEMTRQEEANTRPPTRAKMEFNAWEAKYERAFVELFTTKPTTLAGVVALLQYLAAPDTQEDPAPDYADPLLLDAMSSDDDEVKAAAREVLPLLAEAISNMNM